MAEIEKLIDQEKNPEAEDIDIQLEGEEEKTLVEEIGDDVNKFYSNLAEDINIV